LFTLLAAFCPETIKIERLGKLRGYRPVSAANVIYKNQTPNGPSLTSLGHNTDQMDSPKLIIFHNDH